MAAVLLVSFIPVQIIYRLSWSPLARFALTFAYEFFFDVWKPEILYGKSRDCTKSTLE